MKLYDYYRSSCSYRVRIALNIKNLEYEVIPVHLLNNGGEQHSADYKKINPQEVVPTLETNDGILINQSLAILGYLDETYKTPPLLPEDPIARAKVREICLLISCEIHPLNNLRVLQTLVNEYKFNDEQKLAWYHKWLKLGFDALELKLASLPRSKMVCYGDSITLADICLIPQVYNAKRFKFNLDDYHLISQIGEYCNSLEPFKQAVPKE
ncbi:MAG: maleylacetoacetate isomerase [Legionellales bacterium RIFCSPHIGHO2_12_FULL_35_11]|nr:MAG: maleylacetoacetate isomerase [Legionellales bacterium RIFCSPHIGHO2_12_FULL_35_11]